MTKDKEFMGTMPIRELLVQLSVPAMIGMIVNALYNLVDTIFVGHGAGSMAIAGLSIAFPVQMLIGAFAQMFGVGAASIVSLKLGEKKEKEASLAAGNGITLALITALIIAILGTIFMTPLLQLVGASSVILPYASDYLHIILFGSVFLTFSFYSNNLIRSEGNAKQAMRIMLSGAIINIILDPLFIFGFDLGIKGAAYATVISQVISSGIALKYFLQKKGLIRFYKSSFKLESSMAKNISLLGISSFIRQLGGSIIAVFMNNLLGVYGGDLAIAAYGMVTKVMMICLMPIFGILQGFQPIAGYNYGAQKYSRVRKVLIDAIVAGTIMGLAFELLLQLFPGTILSMFTTDQALLAIAIPALQTVTLTIFVIGIQGTGSTYFQAIGKSRPAIFLGLSRQFIFFIPILFIMAHYFGLIGIWMTAPISDILATIITAIWSMKDIKKLPKDVQEIDRKREFIVDKETI